jgi:hypothetical protein
MIPLMIILMMVTSVMAIQMIREGVLVVEENLRAVNPQEEEVKVEVQRQFPVEPPIPPHHQLGVAQVLLGVAQVLVLGMEALEEDNQHQEDNQHHHRHLWIGADKLADKLEGLQGTETTVLI